MADPKAIYAVSKFSTNTGTTWRNTATPVPDGLLTIDSDTGICKMGNGADLYINLPILFNAALLSGSPDAFAELRSIAAEAYASAQLALGSAVASANGAVGATGAQGSQGPQGPQGIAGLAGAAGAAGVAGSAGTNGSAGAAGAAGIAGAIGPTGPKGDTGTTGATGPIGPAGTNGIDGGGGGTAAGTTTIEIPILNLNIADNTLSNVTTNLLLYQLSDLTDFRNLLLLSIEFDYADYVGCKFTFDLWAGDPTLTTSHVIYSYGSDILFTPPTTTPPVTTITISAGGTLANSDLRKGIYARITNRLTSRLRLNAKLVCLALPVAATPVVLPVYVPPAGLNYTGPSPLATVNVGPLRVFTEMADAIPYMSPGFTMTVDAGVYYKPFLINPGMDGFTIQNAPGVTPDQIVCNGRGGWVTGYPAWQDNGPAVAGFTNPFRLRQGKGFMLVRSPGTIMGMSFLNCGGGYGTSIPQNDGDGECAIYTELFAVPATLHIYRCMIDGGENGLFVPIGTNGQNVKLLIDHCSFSLLVANGQTSDGLSHNVYLNGMQIDIVDSDFYPSHALGVKFRSPLVTITRCYIENSAGECINQPEGGRLTVVDTIISAKPTDFSQTNFMGFAVENRTNGATLATFSNCKLYVNRGNSAINVGMNGSSGTPSDITIDFFPVGGIQSTIDLVSVNDGLVSIGYGPNRYQGGVVNLPNFPASALTPGQPLLSSFPARPAIPAHLRP